MSKNKLEGSGQKLEMFKNLYQSLINLFSNTDYLHIFFALNANFFFVQRMKAIKTLDFYLANNSGLNYSKKDNKQIISIYIYNMEAIIYASDHVTLNKMRKLAFDCRTS
jgi:hypothetical protein